MKKFKNAFTLVEVLLVMAIIGVVGVLAVTNARRDTDTAEKISQLRRTYEIIDAAFTSAYSEQEGIWHEGVEEPTTAEMWDTVSSQLKLTENCKRNNGCWKNAKILKRNNTESNLNIYSNSEYAKGILINGASIAIRHDGEGQGNIYVDVNGPEKGMQKFGDDVFLFEFREDGTVKPFNNINFSGQGDGFTSWALMYGNLDYLKADSSGECPDGTDLSDDENHTCRNK